MQNSFLNKLNLFVRSLIFSIIFWVTVVFQSFYSVLASPLPLKYRYKLIVNYINFLTWALKVVCGVKYKIDGLDNIPHDRSGVILSKHQSTWETLFLPAIFNQPAIILKRELLWIPFFGWGLATISPIAINRKKTASAMEQIIKEGKKCLEEGRWILVFPEGTRIPVGKVGRYHLGGARLAVATDAPIIPVAHNAGYFWPRRRFLKRPGTVHVMIGPLIETTGRTPEEVMAQAKSWIEGKMENLVREG